MKRTTMLLIVFVIMILPYNNLFAQEVTLKDTVFANKFFRIADSLMVASYYDSSLIYFEKASAIYKKSEMWKKYFRSEFRIATIYGRQKKLDKALKKAEHTLWENRTKLGSNGAEEAYGNYIIGTIYLRNQKIKEAKKYLDKGLAQQLKTLGENNIDVANSYTYLGVSCYYELKYKEALEYWLKSTEIYKNIFGTFNIKIANTYNNIGAVYEILADYDKALDYHMKALEIREKLLGKNHIRTAASYNNIAVVYIRIAEYDLALKYLFNSLNIKKEVLGNKNIQLANSYHNIADIYSKKAEYALAEEYNFKALDIRQELLGEKHKDVALSYNSIGIVYWKQGMYELAINFLNKSLKIRIELFGENNIDVAETYTNLGLVFKEKSQYKIALEYEFKALKIQQDFYNENYRGISSTLYNIGIIYKEMLKYDLALKYLLQTLDIDRNEVSKNYIFIIRDLNSIANIYESKGMFYDALSSYQQALNINLKGYHDSNYFNKVECDIKYISYKPLLTSLAGKAKLLNELAEKNDNSDIDLKQLALQHYQFADKVIQIARKRISNRIDKIYLGENANKIYEQASEICFSLSENNLKDKANLIKQAFYFSEQSKSIVLSESLAKANALKFAGLPDSLIKKEKLLKKNIALYTQKLAEPQDSIKEILFRTKLFDNNREYETLISLFEDKYHKYYELINKNNIVSVEQLQDKLDKRTSVISYALGDSSLFIFIISKEKFNASLIPIKSAFNQSVKKIIAALKTGEFYDLAKESNYLYEILIKSIFNKLNGKTKLVVIPDGILNKVPFEVLSEFYVEKSSLKANEYLINNFEISYSPSATLYFEAVKKHKNIKINNYASQSFIGIAPVFANINGNGVIAKNTFRSLDTLTRLSITDLKGALLELPYSKEEINSVGNFFKGRKKVLLNSEATEDNFKKEINNNRYIYIHISTHGIANEENPELSCLSFSQPKDSTFSEDGFLFSGETYNLDLTGTDLLVLSSCESGVGKIAKGEGMLSLTRGFLYAGARNIIYSLWKINDKFTSEFMTHFYKKMITEKHSYSSALRASKLEMIKKNVFPGLWASFVLVEN